jgi:hypothetical protein
MPASGHAAQVLRTYGLPQAGSEQSIERSVPILLDRGATQPQPIIAALWVQRPVGGLSPGCLLIGSLADLNADITPTAASGGKAVVKRLDFEQSVSSPRNVVCARLLSPKAVIQTLQIVSTRMAANGHKRTKKSIFSSRRHRQLGL